MPKKKVPSMVKDQQLIKKRREQMIKGAVSLFKEKGFHRTTTREIARESGFSIGTLYEYIGSKEDVLYLVCDDIYEKVMTRLEDEQVNTSSSGLDRLKQVMTSFFKVMDEMQDEVLVMYQEVKALPKEALPYVLQKEEEMTSMMERIILECSQSGELEINKKHSRLLAHHIMVSGQMWTFRRWALQHDYSIEEFTEWQIHQLLFGVVSHMGENVSTTSS